MNDTVGFSRALNLGLSIEQVAALCDIDGHHLMKMMAGEMPMGAKASAISSLLRGCRQNVVARLSTKLRTEMWMHVPGYPGYEASDQGNIRRITQFRGHAVYKLLKPNKRTDGYLRVVIWVNGARKNRHVHRLVCLAFNGVPVAGVDFACHRDGTRVNNVPDNLYWGSASDNYADQVTHGTARLKPGVKARNPLVPPNPERRKARKVKVKRVKAKNPQNMKKTKPYVAPEITPNLIRKLNKIKMLRRIERSSNAEA